MQTNLLIRFCESYKKGYKRFFNKKTTMDDLLLQIKTQKKKNDSNVFKIGVVVMKIEFQQIQQDQ